jgi:hypothetical protein
MADRADALQLSGEALPAIAAAAAAPQSQARIVTQTAAVGA